MKATTTFRVGFTVAWLGLWAGPGALAGEPAKSPLVLQLDWRLNAQFAGPLLAEARGLYREAGVAVEIRPLGELVYERLARTVAETEGMIGSIEGGLFLSGRAEGLSIVAIGTMFQASSLGLISLESAGIAGPADLAGKHVSIHDDGHEALDTVLFAAGLDRTKVRVSVSGYGMAGLLAGEYDAKQGYLVDEYVKLVLGGERVRALEYRLHGHRAYSQVYFVSERTLAGRREELARFLAASGEGWARAAESPEETARFLHERHAPDLPLDYLEASLRRIVLLLTAEQATMGAMLGATWEAQVASLEKLRPGTVGRLGPMERWVDFSLIKGAR
ncbi:MAG: ABC transporter substrate-binding protein [Burkholderiales bacterium]|nr:ABC transporter substrate-binding protein [Opitutaceae bacterium]